MPALRNARRSVRTPLVVQTWPTLFWSCVSCPRVSQYHPPPSICTNLAYPLLVLRIMPTGKSISPPPPPSICTNLAYPLLVLRIMPTGKPISPPPPPLFVQTWPTPFWSCVSCPQVSQYHPPPLYLYEPGLSPAGPAYHAHR